MLKGYLNPDLHIMKEIQILVNWKHTSLNLNLTDLH